MQDLPSERLLGEPVDWGKPLIQQEKRRNLDAGKGDVRTLRQQRGHQGCGASRRAPREGRPRRLPDLPAS